MKNSMMLAGVFVLMAGSVSPVRASEMTTELCGFISQELEGTWLEVAIEPKNPNTSYTVHVLEGVGVEAFKQGEEVCVDVLPADARGDDHPHWKVIGYRKP